TTLSGSVEQQATQVSGVQTTFGGVCGAKKGGLALHFGLESAAAIVVFMVVIFMVKNVLLCLSCQ
ncbi:hypothetical protein, partial [Providencia rustigianii]|uniref:hypothetical protein n=1 Tax=Providencia rustigianii TaxID=158850 RepID=UPI00223F6198